MIASIAVTNDSAFRAIKGAERQMPFAVAQALTWVAEDVKFQMAREVDDVFTVRTPWVKSPQRWQVTRARKEDYPHPTAYVDLDPKASFLADFETGKTRLPGDRAYDRVTALANAIYMPTRTLRPAFGAIVPQMFTPKAIGVNLRLDPAGSAYHAGRGAHSRRTARAAARKFFRMRPAVAAGPAAGVWERYGSGKGLRHTGNDQLRFLWKALPSVHLPRRMRTLDWARKEVLKQWPDKMERSLAVALATAR